MTKEEFKEKVREKKQEFKDWWIDATWKASRFWLDNREMLVVIVPAVAAVGGKLIASANKHGRIKEEEYLKKRFMYDRSMGAYLEMRRQPTQRELLEINRLKREGYSLPEILAKLKLLK